MNNLRPLRHLLTGIAFLVIVIVIGVAGFHAIEGWSFLDSVFMTVITLTTVGYGEVHPLSDNGKIFSIFLILGGVGSVSYIFATIVPYTVGMLENELGIRSRRSMESKIKAMSGHFIVCGYGRVGQAVARIFEGEKAKFVLVERDETALNDIDATGYLYIKGDATKDEVLKQAGIERACGLVIALGNDAENTYVTLGARAFSTSLPIYARASNEDAEEKLKRAGANRVISPYSIGGRRLALLALRPVAVDFVETVMFSHEKRLLLEEMEVRDHSTLLGATVRQVEEGTPGIKIMAIKKGEDGMMVNPAPMTVIGMNDRLTVFGTAEQLRSVENCCR